MCMCALGTSKTSYFCLNTVQYINIAVKLMYNECFIMDARLAEEVCFEEVCENGFGSEVFM